MPTSHSPHNATASTSAAHRRVRALTVHVRSCVLILHPFIKTVYVPSNVKRVFADINANHGKTV
jgi:hypothetical protein